MSGWLEYLLTSFNLSGSAAAAAAAAAAVDTEDEEIDHTEAVVRSIIAQTDAEGNLEAIETGQYSDATWSYDAASLACVGMVYPSSRSRAIIDTDTSLDGNTGSVPSVIAGLKSLSLALRLLLDCEADQV